MPFTGKDLMRLKENIRSQYGMGTEQMLAFIARAEAAELCAELLGTHQQSGNILDGNDNAMAIQALKVWLTASGRGQA